jgi:hypothetical protein
MSAVIKGAIAAALLAGGSLAGTAPAQAHDRTGTAIVAGIIGLGIGAAIASDHHGYRSDAYYGGGYDYAPSGYYAQSPAYYGGGYSYGYVQPSYGGYGYDRGYYGHRHGDGRWDRRDHDRRDYDRRDYDGRDRGDWDRDGYRH